MLRLNSLIICLLSVLVVLGQTPRIDKVERQIAFPLTTVEIIGSGFSTNAAQLNVWFGHVRGTIQSASETRLVVQVPAQARLGSVEVINLSSRRSGKSSGKFMMDFSGCEPFANSFSAVAFENPDDIFDLCVCDFDGDGRPDIAGSKFRDNKSNIMLLINQSTVSANNTTVAFTQTSIPLNFPTFSLTCGDLNGDGKPEIVATRGGTITGSTVYIFPNTSSVGSVSFGAPVTLDLLAGDFAREVAIHDLNGDGRPEIIVTNGATNLMYVYDNQLTSASIVAAEFSRVSVSAGTSTLSLDIADVTGDGWPDILTSPNANAQRVVLLRNPGNGTLNFPGATNINIGGSQNINDIATADFNKDGRLDIVVADRGANKAFVYLNNGNSLFTSVNGNTGFAAPSAWGVDVGDMNGDGFADFVVGSRDFGNPQINIFIHNKAATPSFTATKIVTPKANWFVKLGDLDGDAKPDIAVTSTNNTDKFSIDVIKNRNCHKPVILNPGPITICSGQTITLQAVPMPGVTLSWSTGATGPTATITAANAGTITLTAVGDGGTCTCSSAITVTTGLGTAPAKPVISGPDGVCAGSALTLTTATVAGSPTYIWSGPNGFETTTATPSVTVSSSATRDMTGSYSLVVKTGDCSSERSDPKPVTVVEPEGFIISSSSGNAGACTGQSIALSVNPVSGYNYQWRKGGTNIAGQTSPTLNLSSLTAGSAGSYTVLVSHQTISCSSETSPFVLSVFNTPVADFSTSPAQVCVGTEVTFNGTSSTVDNNATPNFVWDFGDQASGSGVTTTHTYLNPLSTATVRLTISYMGISGCSNTTTKSIVVSNAVLPVITTDPVTEEICNDGSETVVLDVPGNFTSFLWNVSANNTGSSISVRASGTYSVTTTDNNGCTGNASITLNPKAECAGTGPPPIDLSPSKVFTPNGDGRNDFWAIRGIENYSECTMSVFDGRGMRVFQITGYPEGENVGWDGNTSGGKAVPDGTYFYVFSCPNGSRLTGSVLVVRK